MNLYATITVFPYLFQSICRGVRTSSRTSSGKGSRRHAEAEVRLKLALGGGKVCKDPDEYHETL